MGNKTNNTSVVAKFSSNSSRNGTAGIALSEDKTLASTIGITHIKVYPKMPDIFFITAGSYRVLGRKEEPAQTAIAFNLQKESELPIFGALDVKITPQGNAFNEKGELVDVSYSFNPLAGTIVASAIVYSVVLVTYTAPYTLLEYAFAGEGCPLTPVKNPSTLSDYDGYYTAAMVVARDTTLDASATLQLKPPQCGSDMDMATFIDINDRILSKLVLEVDDGIGVTLERAQEKISAGGSIRLYPAGTLANISAEGGSVRRKYQDRELSVKENVTFNGSSSTSLKYPPINKAGSIGEYIEVVNAVGNPVTVSLATAGDKVYLASFSDDGTYELVGVRNVENDEVVAVNSAGIAIPIWGTATVGYSTSYELLHYVPPTTHGIKRTFTDSVLTAKIDNRVATLKIDPPALGGSLRQGGKFKRT